MPREIIFTQAEKARIWELFFGEKYAIHRIAQEYGAGDDRIITAIDNESERRWRENHPREINRVKLVDEES